eukprot:scaffold8005_cov118-Isochrysis_galbana.AAC.22
MPTLVGVSTAVHIECRCSSSNDVPVCLSVWGPGALRIRVVRRNRLNVRTRTRFGQNRTALPVAPTTGPPESWTPADEGPAGKGAILTRPLPCRPAAGAATTTDSSVARSCPWFGVGSSCAVREQRVKGTRKAAQMASIMRKTNLRAHWAVG